MNIFKKEKSTIKDSHNDCFLGTFAVQKIQVYTNQALL